MFNPDKIKKDFSIFSHQPDLVYLDSAAMSLKPKKVIEAVSSYYETYSANIYRGIYQLSEKATEVYEKTREKVAKFINAPAVEEVIFVRNTTEALNLIAYSWGRVNLEKEDEIITTIMEHHSNFVPWQVLTQEIGAEFKVIDIDKEGELDIYEKKRKTITQNWKTEYQNLKLDKIITKKTKILTLTYTSNVLGTINPVKEIIAQAKKINPDVLTIVDAAQALPHFKVDVQDLGCDFLAFSGQKMLGPTGAGVLWGKKEILKKMPPFLYGGEMINAVYLDKTLFADLPNKFEAGTPDISAVIGLGAAIDYLNAVGFEAIQNHEKELTAYALEKLKTISGLTVYGPTNLEIKSGVISFNLSSVHAHDLAQVLDEDKICIRSGHHCAMPLHTRLALEASARVSFYFYNTFADVDRLIAGLKKAAKIFR